MLYISYVESERQQQDYEKTNMNRMLGDQNHTFDFIHDNFDLKKKKQCYIYNEILHK